MSVDTQLETVQMHIQRERQKESDLERKLADVKDSKGVDFFHHLMRSSAQTLALKQPKVSLLHIQQGGDNRYVAPLPYLRDKSRPHSGECVCILQAAMQVSVASSVLCVLPRFLTSLSIPLQTVNKCFAPSNTSLKLYLLYLSTDYTSLQHLWEAMVFSA